jgi:hydroxypyruvate reductase
MSPVRQQLVVLGTVPAELRAALQPAYELIARSALAPGAGGGFEVAVTTSIDGASKATMDLLPDLRMIACNGAGLEKIDVGEARRRAIAVCNTPDAVTEDTAEYAIGLIFALLRRVVEADRFIRTGKWAGGKMTPSHRLAGRTLGIVGLGKIGQGVARRAAALGLSVLYTATREKSGMPYRFISGLAELATLSDVLVVCLPGGAATRELINAEVLAQLGRAGYLVNVSRGSVVDESALIEALRTGVIAGAALDVFASEPHFNQELQAFENVVLSPHYAAITHETRAAIAADLRHNIDAFFNGQPVRNSAAGGQEK